MRRVDSGCRAQRSDRRESLGKVETLDAARIEIDVMAVLQMMPNGTRDDIARREFGARHMRHEARALFIDQYSAFAAHRLADEL